MSVSDSDPKAELQAALTPLIDAIVRTSLRASRRMGIEFDMDDPRVVRWVLLATFEAMYLPHSKSTHEELLRQAAEASVGETRLTRSKKHAKGQRKYLLITWDDLVESITHSEDHQASNGCGAVKHPYVA